MSYTKEQAIEAYVCVRRHNHSIPDESLDSMKAALLAFHDVMDALEELVRTTYPTGPYSDAFEPYHKALAAIAKAKGQ